MSFLVFVFDPETGGQHDQLNGSTFDTQTSISIYGGIGAYSNKDARQVEPIGQYDSGIQLITKTFGSEEKYDNITKKKASTSEEILCANLPEEFSTYFF